MGAESPVVAGPRGTAPYWRAPCAGLYPLPELKQAIPRSFRPMFRPPSLARPFVLSQQLPAERTLPRARAREQRVSVQEQQLEALLLWAWRAGPCARGAGEGAE